MIKLEKTYNIIGKGCHFILCCSLMVFLFFGALEGNAQTKNKERIYHIKITTAIDVRTKYELELALNEAKEAKVDRIVIELDTYGGGLYDADKMRKMILEQEKPIYVFINNNAASAGALISIACDSIYMASGGSIGAATVVNPTGEEAPDKYQSYMKAIMRSTAEATGRNPEIAEAMVDQSIEIEGIIKEGKVISFTTSEAIKHNFCEAEVSSLDQLLKEQLGIKNYELLNYEMAPVDSVIQTFMNPFLSGLLLLIIIGGIYFELQSPGVGFPIVASIIAAILYFIPYYLTGLAANWEIILFLVGLVLIALEVFVIPGFGVAGIGGILAVVFSLAVVTLNNEALDFNFVASENIAISFLTVTFCTLAGIFGILLIMPKVMRMSAFSGIVHGEEMTKEEGYISQAPHKSILNAVGLTYTVLRPSGKIIINEKLYNASSTGEFIEKGVEIVVISEEGSSVKVRRTK